MNKIVHYLGLDVHKESIAISIAPQHSTEVRRYGIIGGTLDAVDKFIKRLSQPGVELRFVYEAGPCGFVLCRHLRSKGLHCDVVAPNWSPDLDRDSRLPLEWIARGLTAKSFWTARRRWIAALEGGCGFASRRTTAPDPVESE